MNWNKALLLVVLCAGVSGIIYNRSYLAEQLSLPTSSTDRSVIGKPRPAFTLKDTLGIPTSVSEWQGKIIILNFWATWCAPCKREIPLLMAMQDRYFEDIQVVGIAVDQVDTVRDYLNATPISYPILTGNEDETIPVAVGYGNDIGIIPYTVIIDRDGIIQANFFSEVSQQKLENHLKSLL